MFAGAYWGARNETREQIADRVARFLLDAAEITDVFSRWMLKGDSRDRSSSDVSPDAARIAPLLQAATGDLPGRGPSNLGYSIGLWNLRGCSLRLTMGATSSRVSNVVVLKFRESDLDPAQCKGVLEAALRAFDPDRAVVTSHQLLRRAGARNAWEHGLFRYERGQGIVQDPQPT